MGEYSKLSFKSIAEKMSYFARNYIIAIVLFLIIIVVSIITPTFFTLGNIQNILKQVSVVGIIACGMSFVIISGMIDLSVGSIVSLVGVLYVQLYNSIGIAGALIVSLATGAVCGLVTGGIITWIKGKLGASFIVTFGMQSIIGAAAMVVSGGTFKQGPSEPQFTALGYGLAPILAFVLILAVCQFLLVKTKQGRVVYFIGENSEATRLSGIRTRIYRISVFVVNGLLAAFAAIVLTSRVGAASPSAGIGYELDAIAAVVVGGVSLLGGRGSFLNTFLGVILLGVLGNALNILGVSSYPQMIVKGALIIFAVLVDAWGKSRKRKD